MLPAIKNTYVGVKTSKNAIPFVLPPIQTRDISKAFGNNPMSLTDQLFKKETRPFLLVRPESRATRNRFSLPLSSSSLDCADITSIESNLEYNGGPFLAPPSIHEPAITSTSSPSPDIFKMQLAVDTYRRKLLPLNTFKFRKVKLLAPFVPNTEREPI